MSGQSIGGLVGGAALACGVSSAAGEGFSCAGRARSAFVRIEGSGRAALAGLAAGIEFSARRTRQTFGLTGHATRGLTAGAGCATRRRGRARKGINGAGRARAVQLVVERAGRACVTGTRLAFDIPLIACARERAGFVEARRVRIARVHQTLVDVCACYAGAFVARIAFAEVTFAGGVRVAGVATIDEAHLAASINFFERPALCVVSVAKIDVGLVGTGAHIVCPSTPADRRHDARSAVFGPLIAAVVDLIEDVARLGEAEAEVGRRFGFTPADVGFECTARFGVFARAALRDSRQPAIVGFGHGTAVKSKSGAKLFVRLELAVHIRDRIVGFEIGAHVRGVLCDPEAVFTKAIALDGTLDIAFNVIEGGFVGAPGEESGHTKYEYLDDERSPIYPKIHGSLRCIRS